MKGVGMYHPLLHNAEVLVYSEYIPGSRERQACSWQTGWRLLLYNTTSTSFSAAYTNSHPEHRSE